MMVKGPFVAVALFAISCLRRPSMLEVVIPQTAQPTPPNPAEDAPYSGPSEPYTWKSVAIGGGGFVTGLTCLGSSDQSNLESSPSDLFVICPRELDQR
jgi:hypothetical protein